MGIRANTKHLLVSGLPMTLSHITLRAFWPNRYCLSQVKWLAREGLSPSFPESKAILSFPAP